MTKTDTVTVNNWEDVFNERGRAKLEAILPAYIHPRRWFGGKARTIKSAEIVAATPFPYGNSKAYLANVNITYSEGDSQVYVMPLTFAAGEQALDIEGRIPDAVITKLRAGGQDGVLYDASSDTAFAQAILTAVENNQRFAGNHGTLVAVSAPAFKEICDRSQGDLQPSVMNAEQSNTSIRYGQSFILKLFRRLESGISPDLEIGRFLTEQGFKNTPSMAGWLEFHQVNGDGEPLTLAILQGFVPNKGDAWSYTLNSLDEYFERARIENTNPVLPQDTHVLDVCGTPIPQSIQEALGPYLGSAQLLGRRTAEMHIALAGDSQDPGFEPRPFTHTYQRTLQEEIANLADQAFWLLDQRINSLPDDVRKQAEQLSSQRAQLLAGSDPLIEREISALRTRCHGDYHLGQVLYTGDDFSIIDFEGEPVRSLAERRVKHSPLKDVAGMLRSFHYAAYAALFNRDARGADTRDERAGMEQWTEAWHRWVSAAFLESYLEIAGQGNFLPELREDLHVLLDAYLLEKAVYELIYELNNRPGWVKIPLQGIMQLIN